MLSFQDKTIDPPGGWKFYCPHCSPDTPPITGSTFAAVRDAIKKHYRSNNIPIQMNFDEMVEDNMCSHLPFGSVNCRHYEAGPVLPHGKKIGFEEVYNFLNTMLLWVGKGGKFVEPAEADRRALICSRCPYNVAPEGCGHCHIAKKLGNVAAMVRGKRRTPSDNQLKACAVCGCSNQAQVHFPLDVLNHAPTYPEWCWHNPDK